MTDSRPIHRLASRSVGPPIRPLHLLLLLNLSVAVAVWAVTFIGGSSSREFEMYLALLGFYGLASANFLFGRIGSGYFRLFDIPVFITVLCFVEFGLAPVRSFLDPRQLNRNFNGDYGPLLRALGYVIAGMMAFWAGCFVARSRRKPGGKTEAVGGETAKGFLENRTLLAAGALFLIAFVIRLYLLHAGLYSYTQSAAIYYRRLASTQVLMVVAQLGAWALIALTIEKFSHPSDMARRVLFLIAFVTECMWGLVSGMKGGVLQNFLFVALVASLVERRLRKDWILAMLCGLVALYPLMDTYRSAIRKGGGEVTSLTAAGNTGLLAIQEASRERSAGEWGGTGWRQVVARLDLLQSVGLVIALESQAAHLEGDERWWMIPFYPYVPRFFWPSKPILNKGQRFGTLLGSGGRTSTAITYPGDLYLGFGLPGILAGMLILGVVVQWLTNTVTGPLKKRALFLYAAVFVNAISIEIDMVSFWSALVKFLTILIPITWLLYGAGSRPIVRRPAARFPVLP